MINKILKNLFIWNFKKEFEMIEYKLIIEQNNKENELIEKFTQKELLPSKTEIQKLLYKLAEKHNLVLNDFSVSTCRGNNKEAWSYGCIKSSTCLDSQLWLYANEIGKTRN